MPVLSAKNLAKAYGANPLLDGVTFTIDAGEKVGVIGANGTGKSTLLRALAGEEPVDGGAIERQRDAKILFLPQEPRLEAGRTPKELVEQGLAEWHAASTRHAAITRALEHGEGDHDALLAEQAHLAEAIERHGGWERGHVAEDMLAKLGVRDLHRTVDAMSGGERRRVALAQLLVASPDLAILDEPTNHLDTETIEWLEGYLAESFPGAVLLVTHDRYVLDAIADRIFELDRGKLTEFKGGYGDYLEQKAEMLAHEARVEANRLNLLRRERAWLMRGAKARTTKQKARIQRAEALLGVDAPKQQAALSLRGVEQNAERLGKTILDLEGVRLTIEGRPLVRDLTLRMVSGERIGIIGPNGAGKTSLLKLVSDELDPAVKVEGNVVRGVGTKIAYFDQARALLRDDWSVFDNVAEREGAERTGAGAVQIGPRTVEMRTYLEQFLFEGQKQRQKVGSLSGGERARVALAKVLKSGANMLLLDEPTNDLDVATLGALEDLLETWPGCVLVVSHDRYFLNRVATSILAFEGDGKVVRYPGSYDTYRRLREEAEATRAAAAPAAPAPRAPSAAAPPVAAAAAKAEPGRKPLTYAERLELEKLLDRVAEAESRVAALEAELADPALYTARAAEAGALTTKLDAARREVATLTARWEELEARA